MLPNLTFVRLHISTSNDLKFSQFVDQCGHKRLIQLITSSYMHSRNFCEMYLSFWARRRRTRIIFHLSVYEHIFWSRDVLDSAHLLTAQCFHEH
jgi:hypothetical protein